MYRRCPFLYMLMLHIMRVCLSVCVRVCKIEQSWMKCFAVKGQQPRVYQPYSEFALSSSWWWFCPAPVFVPLLPQPFRGLCSSICSMSRVLGGTSTALQISSISDPFWLWVLIELDSLHRKLCLVFWRFGRKKNVNLREYKRIRTCENIGWIGSYRLPWALVSFLFLGILAYPCANLRKYDFLYLPIDFDRKANLGYAFVNLVDEESHGKIFGHLGHPESLPLPPSPSDLFCSDLEIFDLTMAIIIAIIMIWWVLIAIWDQWIRHKLTNRRTWMNFGAASMALGLGPFPRLRPRHQRSVGGIWQLEYPHKYIRRISIKFYEYWIS